ncbi:MAG: glycosyl hydrolase, partial [Sphingomonadales bacterium]
DVVQHSGNPDLLLATSYQRRRHVWVLIDGGPGSGMHRSDDGGATWTKITAGIPGGDLGRIGLGQSPSNPNIVYAIIELPEGAGAIYRTDDFGVTWNKMSDRGTSSPQYYNELVVDPHNSERVYLMDTIASVSDDGGRNWRGLSTEAKHVDEHALWIDPDDTNHLIIGNDGGVYESYDQGENWRHMRNLPLTQFYRVEVDNEAPFYNIYGGTQDNSSLGVPSRNTHPGIDNSDVTWTLYGDGFQTRVDPTNADIVYSQLQYGLLFRYDRKNGDRVFITPQEDAGEDVYRWNWNSGFIISPHSNTRLYFGAEYLFRSDDGGMSWDKVSGDLTRDLDRNKLEVMDRIWGVDTIAKNASTSMYGSIISISESAITEGLIYVGTDDGLIQITADGGANWTKVDRVKGVPDMSYIGDLLASSHDSNVVYATFDNHKKGDFKPYVYKSTNQGRTWTAITGNLPEKGTVHTIQEDHVDPNLLFVGTEYGIFFSQNGGEDWIQMKSGLPTIAIRDLEIQERENDLVAASFGRGFYVLDDYSPLRVDAATVKEAGNYLYNIKDALLFVEDDRYLGGATGSQGDDFYAAENPSYGAIFSYYMDEGLKTRKDVRQEAEGKIKEEGGDNFYPSWDDLREEDWEEAPVVVFTIRDNENNVVRRITGPSGAGFHRIAWDLRSFDTLPVDLEGDETPGGFYVRPGQYSVSVAKRHDGAWVELTGPADFNVTYLDNGTFSPDFDALYAFQKSYAELMRVGTGVNSLMNEMRVRINNVKRALMNDPDATADQNDRVRVMDRQLKELEVTLNDDLTITNRNEEGPKSVSNRLFGTYGLIPFVMSQSLSNPTEEVMDSVAIATTEIRGVIDRAGALDAAISALEAEINDSAPWTPGQVPEIGTN